jgi:hypothetical protein
MGFAMSFDLRLRLAASVRQRGLQLIHSRRVISAQLVDCLLVAIDDDFELSSMILVQL